MGSRFQCVGAFNSFPVRTTSIISLWLTPDDFTRQRDTSRLERVDVSSTRSQEIFFLYLDAESVKVLYKSDMTFSGRLYASLDVDLCRVRLHDSLTSITQKPLLYVRDIVPRPCFEGLTRLDKVGLSNYLQFSRCYLWIAARNCFLVL